MILAGRDVDGMKETQTKAMPHIAVDANVILYQVDLSDLEHLEQHLDLMFAKAGSQRC